MSNGTHNKIYDFSSSVAPQFTSSNTIVLHDTSEAQATYSEQDKKHNALAVFKALPTNEREAIVRNVKMNENIRNINEAYHAGTNFYITTSGSLNIYTTNYVFHTQPISGTPITLEELEKAHLEALIHEQLEQQ